MTVTTRKEAIAYFEQHVKIMEQPPIHLGSAVAVKEWAKRCDHLSGAYRWAISALREQARWISVEEKLPDDNFLEKEIIVCILNRFGERNVYTKKFWGVNSALWNNDITHWMPLPSPPTEG